MNLHTKALKAFLFWLAAVAVAIITYLTYLGPPDAQFMKIVLLSCLLALSVIYFLFRATKLGKNWATLLAAGWFIGSSLLFTVAPPIDTRILLLALLAMGISGNLALTAVLRRRAVHK